MQASQGRRGNGGMAARPGQTGLIHIRNSDAHSALRCLPLERVEWIMMPRVQVARAEWVSVLARTEEGEWALVQSRGGKAGWLRARCLHDTVDVEHYGEWAVLPSHNLGAVFREHSEQR